VEFINPDAYEAAVEQNGAGQESEADEPED
jgi:hypothetical protein